MMGMCQFRVYKSAVFNIIVILVEIWVARSWRLGLLQENYYSFASAENTQKTNTVTQKMDTQSPLTPYTHSWVRT